MMRKLLFMALGSVMFQLVRAQISELPINNPESVISFSVGFAGGITSIDGRFNKFEGVIGYRDPRDITSLYAELRIEVGSINTGDEERDADLMAPGFFNQKEFPEITFKSTSIKRKSEGYIMVGDFTMMGKTIALEVPFERTHPEPLAWVFGEPRIAVKGQVILDRLEFGIPKRGWNNILPSLGSMSLSKEVKINISMMGMGQGVSAMMMETANTGGAKAAIEKYKLLQAEFGDKENTYSFGGRTLVGVTLQLTRAQKLDDAIAVGLFGVKVDPENFLTHYALAGAYAAKGDKEHAKAYYKKTLELNPDFTRAKTALEKLE